MIARPKISRNEWKTAEIEEPLKLGISLSFPALVDAEEELLEVVRRDRRLVELQALAHVLDELVDRQRLVEVEVEVVEPGQDKSAKFPT